MRSILVRRFRDRPRARRITLMKHCWHDLGVKYPLALIHTSNTPTGQGRVCCYCGTVRSEPLPPQLPRRAHGPYVEDTSHWFVVDDVEECPGMGLITLNPETVVVV